MGAAPRYFGSSDPCRLIFPNRGSSSIHCGIIRPYATTRIASGRISSSRARNSALFLIFAGCTTSSPCSRAARFTEGTCNSIPRPAARSGCVTTRATSCPAAITASSVGTANSGVPQKTSFIRPTLLQTMSCRTGSLRGRRSLRDAYTGRTAIMTRSPPAGRPEHREDPNPSPTQTRYTSHEVTALRAGGPSGRTSPLAVLDQLLNLPNHQIPLQPTQPINKQHSIQMIDLMLHRPCQQLRPFNLEPIPILILRPYLHPRRPRNLLANLRQA